MIYDEKLHTASVDLVELFGVTYFNLEVSETFLDFSSSRLSYEEIIIKS